MVPRIVERTAEFRLQRIFTLLDQIRGGVQKGQGESNPTEQRRALLNAQVEYLSLGEELKALGCQWQGK